MGIGQRKKDMAVVHNLDTKNIKLQWNLENKQVTVTCNSPKLASAYISKLIQQKRIGSISAVFYKEIEDTNIVHLITGGRVVLFIKEGLRKEYKAKTRFKDLLKNKS